MSVYGIVKTRDLGDRLEHIRVEECNEYKAVCRERCGTGDKILLVADGCCLIEALRPVRTAEVEILELLEIGKMVLGSVHYR